MGEKQTFSLCQLNHNTKIVKIVDAIVRTVCKVFYEMYARFNLISTIVALLQCTRHCSLHEWTKLMGFRYSKPTFIVVKSLLNFLSHSKTFRFLEAKVWKSNVPLYICKIFLDCNEKDLTFEAFAHILLYTMVRV